jgi:hypothetical protein
MIPVPLWVWSGIGAAVLAGLVGAWSGHKLGAADGVAQAGACWAASAAQAQLGWQTADAAARVVAGQYEAQQKANEAEMRRLSKLADDYLSDSRRAADDLQNARRRMAALREARPDVRTLLDTPIDVLRGPVGVPFKPAEADAAGVPAHRR